MSDLSAMVAAAAAIGSYGQYRVAFTVPESNCGTMVAAVSKRLICLESLSQVGDQRTNELWEKEQGVEIATLPTAISQVE